jgi:molybdate transport system substrate-binding protein
MLKKILLSFIALAVVANAVNLKVASGAGYKKPLMEVIQEYEKNGEKIDPFFGNMKQVTTQAKQTDIALIVGDKNFLSKKSKLDFKGYLPLGKGKVVVAYPKGKTITSIEDLKKENIGRISMPQPKKAIYGIAGKQFLKNAKLYESVRNKLLEVATAPQAITYVITNEVDAGIINLTAALANKSKIGGYIEVPQQYYTPIEIVAGKLVSCKTKECKKFVDFLSTKTSKDIFKKYGL